MRSHACCFLLLMIFSAVVSMDALAQRPRARALGVPFDGDPGPWNAITDVAGVTVGHRTLIQDPASPGEGFVRTGVTALFPRGRDSGDPVFAAWYSLNGNGEMTGTTWIEESGFLEGPVLITNTHSVGTVRDAVIAWQKEAGRFHQPWSLPVVAETWDGVLNDINGFHVKPVHVIDALGSARAGPVAEGNVGGGTGMICHGFKGGIGTSSRVLPDGHTVGVLVQANYGSREQLRIAGVAVGKEMPAAEDASEGLGSIIIVMATDAPLIPHQLKRIARRAPMGLARMGSIASNGSGDIFLAFSTANPGAARARELARVAVLPNARMNGLFEASIQAVEEAIVNALVAAETMSGKDGRVVPAIPHEQLTSILRRHGRLESFGEDRP